MNRVPNEHLSAERLQALLEGELPEVEASAAEEHLAYCARCSSELDAWRLLLGDLDELPSLRPDEGFVQRVMSRLDTAPTAAGAHLGTAELLEHLDGALALPEAERVRRHLAACAPCAQESARWDALFGRLGSLERLEPSPAFAASVMSEWRLRESRAAEVSVWGRIAAFVTGADAAHPASGDLMSLADGALAGIRRWRVEHHLGHCATCEREVADWSVLLARLDELGRFAPSASFADGVMDAVALPAPVVAPARAPVWVPAVATATALARRTAAAMGRLVPRSKRAWAAISGVAVTPATVAGLVLYAVFSHPTLTVGSLASFAWWQIADLAAAAWSWTAGTAVQSAELFGVYSLLDSIASAPLAVAGGVVAYSLMSALALRVLYRQVVSQRPVGGRYVRVSHS